MEKRLWTLAEVSKQTGLPLRGLERDCRAGLVAHVYHHRRRYMTEAQIEALIASRTESPKVAEMDPEAVENARIVERLQRKHTRRVA